MGVQKVAEIRERTASIEASTREPNGIASRHHMHRAALRAVLRQFPMG